MATRWIIEGNIDTRWPINTRGNIGEVFPEVLTALGYHYGVLPAERACASWIQTSMPVRSPNPGGVVGRLGSVCASSHQLWKA